MVEVDGGARKEIIKLPNTEFIQEYWKKDNKNKPNDMKGDRKQEEMDGINGSGDSDVEVQNRCGSYGSGAEGDDEASNSSMENILTSIKMGYDNFRSNDNDEELTMLAYELEKQLEYGKNYDNINEGQEVNSSSVVDSASDILANITTVLEDIDETWYEAIFGESGDDLEGNALPPLEDSYAATVVGTMPTLEQLFSSTYTSGELKASSEQNLEPQCTDNKNMHISSDGNVNSVTSMEFDTEELGIFMDALQ